MVEFVTIKSLESHWQDYQWDELLYVEHQMVKADMNHQSQRTCISFNVDNHQGSRFDKSISSL